MVLKGRYLQWRTVGSLFRENKLEVSTLLKYLDRMFVSYPWPRLGQEMIVCKSKMIAVAEVVLWLLVVAELPTIILLLSPEHLFTFPWHASRSEACYLTSHYQDTTFIHMYQV